MNATTTIQSGTIQMKRSHLVGLVVGVAALSVALTTGAQAVLDSTDNRASSAPSYVEGVTAMTPEELAATFGNVPVSSTQGYVDAVRAMSPEELAATWGNVPRRQPSSGLHRRRERDDPGRARARRGATPPRVRSPAGPTAATGRELRVRSLARCYEVIPCRPTRPRASSISPM